MRPNSPPPPTATTTTTCKNPNPNPHHTMQALHFLSRLSRISSTPSSASATITRRSRCIRRAAYVSMAHATGPRRAWSRELLRRLRRRPVRIRPLVYHGRRIVIKPPAMSRTEKLRRLVPGGTRMDVCSLLEETGDYIECLRAQVRVMRAIADSFSQKV